jgi:hypothetical protein
MSLIQNNIAGMTKTLLQSPFVQIGEVVRNSPGRLQTFDFAGLASLVAGFVIF